MTTLAVTIGAVIGSPANITPSETAISGLT